MTLLRKYSYYMERKNRKRLTIWYWSNISPQKYTYTCSRRCKLRSSVDIFIVYWVISWLWLCFTQNIFINDVFGFMTWFSFPWNGLNPIHFIQLSLILFIQSGYSVNICNRERKNNQKPLSLFTFRMHFKTRINAWISVYYSFFLYEKSNVKMSTLIWKGNKWYWRQNHFTWNTYQII